MTQFALTDQNILAWNLSLYDNVLLTATLAVGNTRLLPNSIISSGSNGSNYQMTFIQDAIGGRSVTFDSNFKVIGSFDTGPNKRTLITVVKQDGEADVVLTPIINYATIYSTDMHANIVALNLVSGTNTGNDAINSLYSGLEASKENAANKQNSLATDGTGIKFPTVDAVNVGLALKITAPTPTPTTGDILRWDGSQWVSGRNVAVVGSASLFYLDPLIALADNLTLQNGPSLSPEVINTKTVSSALGVVFFERFVSLPVGRSSIPAGIWHFDNYASNSNSVGLNKIHVRINKRVVKSGMTGTFTGTGTTRTFTVTGGTPFVAGDANASRLLAGLIETPTQTAWISGFTSSSVVTVTLTDVGFVNVSGVNLNAIYYFLFLTETANITSATPALYDIHTVQPAFTIGDTDRIVAAYFATTDGVPTRTISLYYGGNTNYSHIQAPISTLHNDLAGLNLGDFQHLTVAEKATFNAKISLLQVIGITLASASWTLVAGFYEYNLANANILSTSVVDVIPENADISIVKTAEILPKTVSSVGSVKLYALKLPTGNIGVTINILS